MYGAHGQLRNRQKRYIRVHGRIVAGNSFEYKDTVVEAGRVELRRLLENT
jgi:hypothetical protein